MTHTLHRTGSEESLNNEFVFLSMPARGINDKDKISRLRRFLEICVAHNAINLGDTHRGCRSVLGDKNIIEGIEESAGAMHGVFDNEHDAGAALKEINEAGLGLSVVISGLVDSVKILSKKAGIPRRHAVLYSLGVWGKTELLPDNDHMDLITMCGHGMIGTELVTHLADEIKAGRHTPHSASEEISKVCCCGVYNATRATEILSTLTKG